MRRAPLIAVAVVAQVAMVHARATEPLVGTWRLDRQDINGERTNSGPLKLEVSQNGDKLAFAFSVPVNNVYVVRMTYALKLDGSEADIKNAQGEKVGTIQMSVSGASQYKVVLTGPNRPGSSGTVTVSADGKTLTSEAETVQAGRPVQSKQVFSRE